jgi:hypothetical protein
MKKIIQLLLSLALVGGAASSGAAPRAAEDPTAEVISTTDSAPRVKRQTAEKHSAPPAKKSTATAKKEGGKATKSTKSKAEKSKTKSGNKAY